MDATLERYFTPEAADLFSGRASERMTRLRDEFRKEGLVVLAGSLSAEGLSDVRAHLDLLGRDVELPNSEPETHARLVIRYSDHVRKNGLVRALMEDRRFAAFLEQLTGIPKVEGRKPSMTNLFKKGSHPPDWHYDGRRVSLVIPTDDPGEGAGGGFAYYPRLRRSGATRLERALNKIITGFGLHRLIRPRRDLRYTPGNFIIFDGDATYHSAMPLTRDSFRRSLLLFFTAEGSGEPEEYRS
jgi:ectoine hydroxylase-related dioxygenase (phytanoyl-CoA dioxygenase family)